MTIEKLQTSISGQVILPSHPNYDELRQVVMGHINRKPAVIVLVANTQDVATVINFANTTRLPLAVRSGGHSSVGHSVVNDGIVLDLRNMNKIEVEVESQTAWVDSGARASQVTNELAAHDLVLGFGDTGSVGVGGITTSGGIGFLVRKYGMTIDNLLAAEVVTADGQIVMADEQNNADLFWGIRGGGGNFGVVTRFRFKLHRLTETYGGMLILPATAETISGCLTLALQAPEELSAIFNVMPAPPMPFLPAKVHGQLIVMGLIMFAGQPAEGEKILAPFRALAQPLADMVRPMEYKDIFFPDDTTYHPLAVSRTMFMKQVDIPVARTILNQLQASDASMRVVQMRALGGAMARVQKDATAFAHRTVPILTNVASFYTGANDQSLRQEWVDETSQLLDQGEPGSYAGFLTEDGVREVNAAYPAETQKRLIEIKRKYDPTNLFQLNQNIKP